MLDAFARAWEAVAFVRERMEAMALSGYTIATDLADRLVIEGTSPREAHARVGAEVARAERDGHPLETTLGARDSRRGKTHDWLDGAGRRARANSVAQARTAGAGVRAMTRVHVWGASGYAAAEVIRLLHSHPSFEVGVLESSSHAGESVADHFPLLRSAPYRFDGPGSVLESATFGDVVVTAGSDDEARAVVPEILARGLRAIDLSSSYRFDASAVYGLTEWYREAIPRCAARCQPRLLPDRRVARALAARRDRRLRVTSSLTPRAASPVPAVRRA